MQHLEFNKGDNCEIYINCENARKIINYLSFKLNDTDNMKKILSYIDTIKVAINLHLKNYIKFTYRLKLLEEKRFNDRK